MNTHCFRWGVKPSRPGVLTGQQNLSPRLVSWLREPGSLTRRCQTQFQSFEVRPCFQGMGQDRLLDSTEKRVRKREVLLWVDQQAFIFAQSVLGGQERGPLSRWLKGLGRRSLGTLLFQHPGFQRGPLQYFRLDSRHALYHACLQALPDCDWAATRPPILWARCCEHRFGRQTIRVTEVFLAVEVYRLSRG